MKGWRTIVFNTLTLILPIMEMSEWKDIIPNEYLPHYMAAVAIINLALRLVTTTPVGKKNV